MASTVDNDDFTYFRYSPRPLDRLCQGISFIQFDERDVVRLRTNYRQGEEACLYRLQLTPAQGRKLFLDYLHRANDEMCVLVQVESVTGIANLAEIAAVDGVDGVFFGPADLSASMGLLGQSDHPEVRAAILDGIAVVRAAGKAPGVLTGDRALAHRFLDAGALFVAVGVDTVLLVDAARRLAAEFTGGARTEDGIPQP